MSAHETFHFHSLDEVRRRISELGLDLELSEDLSPLSHPLKAGDFTIPNRMVVLPMEGCDGTASGAPDELTFRRYKRFAAGGAGLLWVEATAVVEEGRANPRQIWLRRENVGEFARLVEETLLAARQSMGPNHRPMLIAQLTHSGRYSRPGRAPRPIIAHHSKFIDPVQKLPPDYPLISDDELERLEDRYAEAAVYAQWAGFDGVDVKACHRYLISELHASYTREDSRYGGSWENRSRLFRNIVKKIRQAAPGLLVTSRMNAHDAMAYPYGFGMDPEDPNKAALDEPIDLVRFLAENGAPLVNITIGNPYFNPQVNRPFDLPVAGGPIPTEHPLIGIARFVHIVRTIQQAVPGVAVIGGGYSWMRQFFPNMAAANVRNGWASMAGAGRMSFAYPDFPKVVMERGKLEPERCCVACSACTQIMRDGGRSGCVPRDAAIYEPIYKAGRADALDTILAEANTCRQCNDPTCVRGCPACVDIPRFVGHIAAGRFREAYETLREQNLLSAVCGYVCPAETQCEAACINEHYSEHVPIQHLQRWVSTKAVEEGWAAAPRTPRPATGKRVAVLGSGAAGVSAAATLASLGYKVALLDRAPQAGGTAHATIPAERLPIPILQREVDAVLASCGDVERRQVDFGVSFTLDQLQAEGFDAVLVALGLGKSVTLGSKRPASGVVGALELLAQLKTGARVEGSVLVLGGGNTAIDAAMSAKRSGASDVAIVYRRSFAEMPAWPAERDIAMRAGVNFLILTQPLEYLTNSQGKLTGLKVIRTRLGAPGEDGRRKPEPVPGSEHTLPADLVVEAIGQQAGDDIRQALEGVEFTRQGLVKTSPPSFETTRALVFAAGDLVNGGTTVVRAVAEGRAAALEIDARLTNN
jgi:NADPH-dependent glutamate synthase beta subunit-like oxidoreductase/2,4-dienoyl-CoA reductase-like NADH-dependent reductase (Old Yellow Enzyme family)